MYNIQCTTWKRFLFKIVLFFKGKRKSCCLFIEVSVILFITIYSLYRYEKLLMQYVYKLPFTFQDIDWFLLFFLENF